MGHAAARAALSYGVGQGWILDEIARRDAGGAQPLPDPLVLPLWYWPMGTLAHAAQAVKGAFYSAAPPRRGPAPQPAGGSGLGTVEGGGRAPEPVFPPGSGPGASPRQGHGDRGRGSVCAQHGVQVDHCGRPATQAIATGVPQPPTGSPFLGPPPRPHKRSLEGHTEPPQGVDDEPRCTVPVGAAVRTAHGPHTWGPPPLAQSLRLTEQLIDEVLDLALELLRVIYPQTHMPPAGTSNRLGRAPGGRGGAVANTPQPVYRTGPVVPARTLPPTPGGPGAPPAEPVPHAPGALRRAELPDASPARPPARTGPRGAATGPPARHDHHSTAKGKQQRGGG